MRAHCPPYCRASDSVQDVEVPGLSLPYSWSWELMGSTVTVRCFPPIPIGGSVERIYGRRTSSPVVWTRAALLLALERHR